MDIVTEKWNEIIENLRLEHSLSDVSFKTWILPLKVYDVIENTVYILVTLDGTGDYIDYIEKNTFFHLKFLLQKLPELNMMSNLFRTIRVNWKR